MKRGAGVYKRKDYLYIVNELKTTDGYWIQGETLIIIRADASHSEIGEALLKALALSGSIVSTDFWLNKDKKENPMFKILKFAKLKSWRAFEKEATHCSVTEEKGIMRFAILERRTRGGGYLGKQGVEPLTIPSDSPPEKIGETLLKALELCE